MRPARVHRVQVRGRVFVRLAARQEHDAGHRRGHVSVVLVQRLVRDLVDVGAIRRAVSGQDHVGLQERPVQVEALVVQLGVDRVEHTSRRLRTRVDVLEEEDLDLGLGERRCCCHKVLAENVSH